MRPTLTARIRALQKARKKSEDLIQAATLASFRRMWKKLQPGLRALRKQGDPIDDLLDEWAREFEAAFETTLVNGATVLTTTDAAWWAGTDFTVVYDPFKVVSDYRQHIAELVGMGRNPALRITDTTRDAIRDAINRWYQNADTTLQDLIDALSPHLGAERAKLIAVNETTALISAITKDGMNQAGLHHWTWQTRLEWNVCDICAPMHGQVFSINDPMPPEASHPGCYCVAAAVLE